MTKTIWKKLKEALEEQRAALVESPREMVLQGKGSEILCRLTDEGAKVKELQEIKRKAVGQIML